MNQYNEDYFERGQELGLSCYTNYKWLPELTIPMAHTIIKYLGINPKDKILDFGCAKGYLVYALRLLHYQAWGYDISEYALKNSHEQIKPYLSNKLQDQKFDWIIAKDILEHIDYHDINIILNCISKITDNIFCVIPLGDGKSYNIPSYDLDKTHVIREDIDWWVNTFENSGFNNINYTTRVQNLKENYSQYKNGNLFLKANTKI